MPTKPRKATKRKTPRKPQALAAQVDLPDPEQQRQPVYIMPQRTAGVRVNEDTALTLSAVWACVRVISETLAGLPWRVHRKRRDGGRDRTDHPVTWLLDTQANPETPAFQFRETLVAHALTWGNGYAEIERNEFTREPVWLHQITPDRVEVVRFRGRIIYDVHNYSGPNTVLEADEMFHLRGLGFDGLVGYPVIRLAARSIGVALATEEDAGRLFANGSRPDSMLIHPKALSETAKQNLEKSVNKQKKAGNMLVLEEDIKYQQLGLPPRDAQLIEQRQFTPAEICRWFRVPPHKIADLARATFSNIEHQSIEFVNDSLRPWAERLETEADIKLFGRNNRGNLITILDLGELKRGDLATQTAHAKEMVGMGGWDIDELRSYFDLNPIGGEDGKKRFVSANLVLLDKAGEEVEPEPQSDDEPKADAPTMDEPEERMSRLKARALGVVEDGCRRLLKRETNAAPKEPEALSEWLGKLREYGRTTLTPGVQMLAEVLGISGDTAQAVGLEAFLVQYIQGTDGPQEPAVLAAKVLDCIQKAGKAA